MGKEGTDAAYPDFGRQLGYAVLVDHERAREDRAAADRLECLLANDLPGGESGPEDGVAVLHQRPGELLLLLRRLVEVAELEVPDNVLVRRQALEVLGLGEVLDVGYEGQTPMRGGQVGSFARL